jgi:hypothetical protein
MWFWINFSPIGQAPPPPAKKVTDVKDAKSSSTDSNAKLDG